MSLSPYGFQVQHLIGPVLVLTCSSPPKDSDLDIELVSV